MNRANPFQVQTDAPCTFDCDGCEKPENPNEPTAAHYEKARARGEFPVFKCSDSFGCGGRGVKAIGPGYVENGVFKGATGKCYRCGGKGYVTEKDIRRNRYYDAHVRRVSF